MKKIIYVLAILLIANGAAEAHTWTSVRNTCYLFHPRFQAHAENRLYRGLIYNGPVAFGYNYASMCHDKDKGCTRPRHAYCETYYEFSGVGKISYANVTMDVGGGISHLNWYNDWRLTPGVYDGIPVDTNKFFQLDKKGYGGIGVFGNIDLDENNVLRINDLEGKMYIEPNSNHTVTYHVLVIKFNENMTEEETIEMDEERSHLRFTNIVAEGAVTVTKSGVEISGILDQFISAEDVAFEDDTSFGANLNYSGESFSYNLADIELEEGESLELITYADGGLDNSLVAPDPPPGSMARMANNGSSLNNAITNVHGIKITPNPATDNVSINYTAMNDEEQIEIGIYDVTGKLVLNAYKGNAHKGINTIMNIDISSLTSGMYFIKAKSETHASTTKLIVQ